MNSIPSFWEKLLLRKSKPGWNNFVETTGKALGLDGNPVKMLLHGEENLFNGSSNWSSGLTLQCLKTGLIPCFIDERKEITMWQLKNRGTLLEAVGKVFARLIMNRLNLDISPFQESQLGSLSWQRHHWHYFCWWWRNALSNTCLFIWSL